MHTLTVSKGSRLLRDFEPSTDSSGRKTGGYQIKSDALAARLVQQRTAALQKEKIEYAALATLLKRELEELTDPRLRTLKLLRHPAVEKIIKSLSEGSINLASRCLTITELHILTELHSLGKIGYKKGTFSLNTAGRQLISKLISS